MSATVTVLETFLDSAGATTTRGPTGTATPSGAANTALIALVWSTHFQGGPLPSMSGTPLGKTWTQISTNAWSNADDERRITAFWADGDGATAGTMTVTYPSNDALTYIEIFEVTEMDTASLIVQEVSDRANNSGGDSGTSNGETLTFAAVGDAENVLILATYINNSGITVTPGSGWTEFAEQTDTGPQTTTHAQWKVNDTTADVSWSSTAVRWGQIGFELAWKDPAAGGVAVQDVLGGGIVPFGR